MKRATIQQFLTVKVLNSYEEKKKEDQCYAYNMDSGTYAGKKRKSKPVCRQQEVSSMIFR